MDINLKLKLFTKHKSLSTVHPEFSISSHLVEPLLTYSLLRRNLLPCFTL